MLAPAPRRRWRGRCAGPTPTREEGAAVLARARSQAKSAHATWIAASAGTALADTLLTLGRVPEAAKLLQYAVDEWHRMRAPRQLRASVELGTRCLASTGDRATAEALTHELIGRSAPKELVVARAARTLVAALADVFGTERIHHPRHTPTHTAGRSVERPIPVGLL